MKMGAREESDKSGLTDGAKWAGDASQTANTF
jgi:hypothetical protein